MYVQHPFLLSVVMAVLSAQSPFGRFEGTVQTEWLENGREMRLTSEFAYVDPSSQRWLAPKGTVVDGASIPQFFWTFIGGPFEGKYRNASVVHDVACKTKDQQWKAVHRMFYQASRLGGIGLIPGLVMYGAVYHFGPRWPLAPGAGHEALPAGLFSMVQGGVAGQQQPLPRTLTTEADFLRMREYISRLKGDITLEAIERLTRDFLTKAVPVVPAPRRIAPDDA